MWLLQNKKTQPYRKRMKDRGKERHKIPLNANLFILSRSRMTLNENIDFSFSFVCECECASHCSNQLREKKILFYYGYNIYLTAIQI